MPQLLPDGLSDPAVVEPVAQPTIEYGESWKFVMEPGERLAGLKDHRGVWDSALAPVDVVADDENLFDADTAHMWQSIGLWIDDDAGASISRIDDPRAFGKAGQFTASGASDPDIYTNPTVPLLAGTYTFSMDVRVDVLSTLAALDVSVTASGDGVWTETDASGSEHSLEVGVWERIYTTGTWAPGTTGTARFIISMSSGVTPGQTITFANPCLRVGTGTEFVPSLRIVGDLEMGITWAMDDWIPAGNQLGIERSLSAEANGYRFYVNAVGGVNFSYYDDTAALRQGAGTAPGHANDGVPHDWVIKFDKSAGEWSWTVDGVTAAGSGLTGHSTNAGGAGYDSVAIPMRLGYSNTGTSPLDGKIYDAYVRDGFDGPRVRFIASAGYDAQEAGNDSWEGQDGYSFTRRAVVFEADEVVIPSYPRLAVEGNKVTRTEGVDTLEQWVTMTLATDRYRWEIYNNQYGTEFKQLIEASIPEAEAETEVIRVIREALLVDPRIRAITSVRVVDGRSLGEPSAFVAEVRIVTYTGELKLLQLDLSLTRIE